MGPSIPFIIICQLFLPVIIDLTQGWQVNNLTIKEEKVKKRSVLFMLILSCIVQVGIGHAESFIQGVAFPVEKGCLFVFENIHIINATIANDSKISFREIFPVPNIQKDTWLKGKVLGSIISNKTVTRFIDVFERKDLFTNNRMVIF